MKIQGAAQEEFVLERMTEVFTCLRCCNVALRWLFLHTCSSHKKLHAAVASSAPTMQDLLALLLDTALLEFEVHTVCRFHSNQHQNGAPWAIADVKACWTEAA